MSSHRRILHGLLAGLACALLSLLRITDVSAAEPRRVLLVHAVGYSYSPWSDVAASFRSELIRISPEPIDFLEVSLDTDRVQDPRDERPFVEYLRAILAGRRLDLIVPVSAQAAFFMQRHRSTLYPATPMLIIGADVRRIVPTSLTIMDSAVLSEEDVTAYLENILRLRPDTREVAIVFGSSPADRFWATEFRRELQPFATRVHFTYLDDLTFGEILARVARMPSRSAIFWGLFSEDAAGVPYSQDRALRAMRKVANAPIFGNGDYELGQGIVGGPLTQTHALGQEGATVALRILKGEIPGDIKPPVVRQGAPIYDWRELRRWNIREALLPRDSLVQFREPDAWHRYRWQILTAVMVILLETALIVSLLYERRRRRGAEIEAHARLSELAHMNRRSAIGELSASITHEIQQPLTAILSNTETAELILDRVPSAANIKELLADIRRDDLRASEVIKRMRRLLAKTPLETQEVNLNEVVSEVFEILGNQAYTRRVTLSKSLSSTPLCVRGDRVALQQVVLNLVMNAIDAITTACGTERRIVGGTALVDNASAEVSIEDSGPGIPDGKAEQVFLPFFTTKESGMGMGLSIARTIVESHGGRIWAANHRGGAVFRFTLPLVRRGATVGDHLDAEKHAAKRERQMSR